MAQAKFPATIQDLFSSDATQRHPLGTRVEDVFGREWRYCQAGAADLVVGNCLQSAAQLADHQDTTASAQAIGDTSLTITPGNTAGAANLYEGGMAVIDTTPGLGYSYPIRGHAAITASTAFTVRLQPGWAIVVALTTTSRISLYPNPYKNVIQSPVTTLTGVPVGVCQYIISATEYGWIGSRGLFGTLIAGTPAVGQMLGLPGTAAGAAVIHSGTIFPIGAIMDTGQDGKVQGVVWGF